MRNIYIISLLFLAIFISCRPKVSKIPYIICPEEIISAIEKNNNFVKSLRSDGRLYITTKEFKGVADNVFILKKPLYIKVDLTYLYKPLISIATNGSELSIFYPSKNQFFIGKATKENLNRFLPLSLDLKSLVEIMSGSISISSNNETIYKYLEKDNLIFFHVNSFQDIWVNPENFKIVKFRIYEPNMNIYYEGEFGKFEKINNSYFPTYIKVEAPSIFVKIVIKYKNIVLNPLIDAKELNIIPIDGVKIINLDEEDINE